jgi:hypothetical protein
LRSLNGISGDDGAGLRLLGAFGSELPLSAASLGSFVGEIVAVAVNDIVHERLSLTSRPGSIFGARGGWTLSGGAEADNEAPYWSEHLG